MYICGVACLTCMLGASVQLIDEGQADLRVYCKCDICPVQLLLRNCSSGGMQGTIRDHEKEVGISDFMVAGKTELAKLQMPKSPSVCYMLSVGLA
ncbi:hypothetical protein F4680DRAFT_428488, partial [Xylaria scruposa]